MRIAVVTPAYNERENLKAVEANLSKQSIKPSLWVIVDDQSSDGTLDLAKKLARGRSWIRVVEKKKSTGIHDASFKAFKHGVNRLKPGWRYLMKLDADTLLPSDFFERILPRFEADRSLGIASGICAGEPALRSHPRGNNRIYRRDCWEQIRFPENGLGWDSVDEVYARLHGWQTRAFFDIVCEHRRSKLPDAKYRFHQGRLSRYLGYYWWFVLGRSAKMLISSGVPPSLAYSAGYLKGGLGSADEGTKKAVRIDQRNRIARIMGLE